MSDDSIDQEMGAAIFADFVRLVHRYTGITIAPNRKSMLQGRIRLRLRQLNMIRYAEYLAFVASDAAEKQMFINQVTTNETYFYRTPRVWDFVSTEFLAQWTKAALPKATLRVWSAAASSGEEAYTLGMILESHREANPDFKYEIVGTDISREILAQARAACYSGRSIEALKTKRPELFKKYLEPKSEEQYLVHDVIRSNVMFYQHNLFERLKLNKQFDLVLLRNVLIYFERTDQETVLSKVQLSMKPGGVLIIGESESLNTLKTSFGYYSPLIYRFPSAESSAA